jgi:prephenate dehydrogenase/ADP-ribose pyrophosphatase YjhB (NUDIX family)
MYSIWDGGILTRANNSSVNIVKQPNSILRVGIIGLGLIGGSIALRLLSQRSRVNQIEVYAYDTDSSTIELAQELGAQTCSSIAELAMHELDILIVGTPIDAIQDVFSQLQLLKAQQLECLSNTIVMDVASVKQFPLNLARQFDLLDNYVGAHPMYGTELTGLANSSANLGSGATWAVTTDTVTDLPDTKRIDWVEQFIVQHLVGKVVRTTAAEHDKAVALSSHIPHLLAYELAGLISDESEHTKLAQKLNAGAFHGATRVAHGNTKMFEGMLLNNYHEIVPLLELVIQDLTKLIEALSTKHPYKRIKSVHHFIERSSQFRNVGIATKPLHRHDGDGWVKCRCGKEHWGIYGAAGLFLVRTDQVGQITHILLQHRALWSAEGGTWGTPGGALNSNESAVDGALREAFEEAGVARDQVEVLGEVVRDHSDWKFCTVVAQEKSGKEIVPQIQDQESLAVEWVPISKVRQLPLLTAFGRELDELLDYAVVKLTRLDENL